ncbi:MG406 family protein [Spiroplasma clarkii]|uniref:Uncharacterized protein n=1 Tax=Spiroplasma clarkii TaxID=2139 RepID=A0A2K8KN86_9MOLU|nr:MG406 family protein [Spiroplasma clarkii]ATX70396.1 hypothetical protein SCLAR_v1c00610 [Spiroplasma clarkii]
MMKKIIRPNKTMLWVITLFYLLVAACFTALIITDIITVSWIYGLLLAVILGIVSFIFLRFSISRLVSEENPFEFIFFSILRTGIYAVPFLISVYLSEAINIFGVLIGTLSVALFNQMLIK